MANQKSEDYTSSKCEFNNGGINTLVLVFFETQREVLCPRNFHCNFEIKVWATYMHAHRTLATTMIASTWLNCMVNLFIRSCVHGKGEQMIELSQKRLQLNSEKMLLAKM
jgi:hypothetical protein